MVKSILKIYLSDNKFKSISDCQIKLSFPNIPLFHSQFIIQASISYTTNVSITNWKCFWRTVNLLTRDYFSSTKLQQNWLMPKMPEAVFEQETITLIIFEKFNPVKTKHQDCLHLHTTCSRHRKDQFCIY